MAITRRSTDAFFLERGDVACLLLHGFSGSPAEVRPLGEHLAGEGVTVSAPLLPGHPDRLHGVGWPDWVRSAFDEYERLQARYTAVHLVGFSMGGLIALYLASRQLPASVATLGTAVGLSDARVIERNLAGRFRGEPFPGGAAHSLVRLARLVRRRISAVSAPVLLLRGECDPWMAAELVNPPGFSVRTFPGMGHFLTLERGRDAVYEAVNDWIKWH